MGASALFYRASFRHSAPRRCGLAVVLDIDDPGVTVRFQSQKFNGGAVPRAKKSGFEGRGGVDWNSASGNLDSLDGVPSVALGKTHGGDQFSFERGGGSDETSVVSPRARSGVHEDMGSPSPSPVPVPVPAPPFLSVQVPLAASCP